MPEMLRLLHFIQAQGYDAECIEWYQDSISTQLLIKNGKLLSGKKTKQIKAKFFFIKDRVDDREIKLVRTVPLCRHFDQATAGLVQDVHGSKTYKMQVQKIHVWESTYVIQKELDPSSIPTSYELI